MILCSFAKNLIRKIMEAIFKIRTSEFTLELFEAMKAAFNGSEAVEISVKSQPKNRYKMTEADFVAKIKAAEADTISYHFKSSDLRMLEDKLLKKEFIDLEQYKNVEE
jgi:hypothetical protein